MDAALRSLRPGDRSVRLALTHLAQDAAALLPRHALPERPLAATHQLRRRSWGRCRLRAADADGPNRRQPLCLSEADTVEIVHVATAVATAKPPPPRLLLPPSGAGVRALRYRRRPLSPTTTAAATRWVVDAVGLQPKRRCDAAAAELPQPHAAAPIGTEAGTAGAATEEEEAAEAAAAAAAAGEGCAGAWAAWCDGAAARLSADGAALLRGGADGAAVAAAVRRRIVEATPPPKRSTRVFSNMMCQVHEARGDSPGLDPACAAVAPQLWRLATQPQVVALARRLLGDGCVLHNQGVALVTPSPPGATTTAHAAHAAHTAHHAHAPHQDQPINSALVWAGNVPPPSHPLSLQALWLLQDFSFTNGATYVLPRTQQRAEHIESWQRRNNTPAAALASGLFPVRFVTGNAGDVALAFGSLWHGSSSAHAPAGSGGGGGEWPSSARLALLFEYAPSFVKPLHRYTAEIVRRSVPRRHWGLFPLVDSYGGTWGHLAQPATLAPAAAAAAAASAAPAAVPGPVAAAAAPGCEPTDDVVSVHAWPALLRERPHCVSARTRVVLRGGGAHMPVLGLGTGDSTDDERVIAAAVRAGYRLVDTGQLYDNEEIVGRALRLSGIHREAIFVSSKAGHWCTAPPPAELTEALPAQYRGLGGLHPTSRGTLGRSVCVGGAARTRAALLASLRRLDVAYLDLYLLHWPLTDAAYALDDARHAAVRLEAWAALVELKREGKVRSIGVSNWSPRQIAPLLALEPPAVLQLELHPLLQRRGVRAFCEEHGIMLQAYSGAYKPELRSHPELLRLVRGSQLSQLVAEPAAIASLRWTLQAGAAIIPRSRREAYVATNLHVFWPGFEQLMPPSAMDALARLDRNASLYGLHEIFVSDSVA